METFYVTSQGQRVGPMTLAEVRTKCQNGELALTESYWSEGMAGWLPLHLLITPSVASAQPRYGGFWVRTGAAFIDMLVIGTPLGFVQQFFLPAPPKPPQPGAGRAWGGPDPNEIFLQAMQDWLIKAIPIILAFLVVNFIVSWLYSAIMESSARQATLGKVIVGLKVADLQGGRISFGRATARFFGRYFISSLLTLGFGFLFCVWTQKKQCLHDLVAGTVVQRD